LAQGAFLVVELWKLPEWNLRWFCGKYGAFTAVLCVMFLVGRDEEGHLHGFVTGHKMFFEYW
jgi:hypothetical protein